MGPSTDPRAPRRSVDGSQAAALLVAVGLALAAGLVASLVAPRGPVTTAQALAAMALAAAVGLAGGVLAGRRGILVAQLLAMLVGVELGRIGTDVPSLAWRFDTVYGVIAFIITRGLHLVLLALPMAAGVALGRWLARGRAEPGAARGVPVGGGLLGLLTLALAVLVAWPASTPPVLGDDGQPIPGSIAALETVTLGGSEQTILVRAADPDKPVLLYLSGGPGQSDLALGRVLSDPWVRDFVVVDLDQRGNGTSYPAIDPLSAMTLDRAVSDVVELTEHLRERFDEPRIYLMGESWGTILGVLAVQRRPDLYAAFIGSGQMVDVVETDRRIYDDLVAHATRTGNTELAAKLAEIGQPPYRDIPWANSNLLAWYEYLYKPYTPSAGYMARGSASGLDPFGVLGSEYGLIDKANVLRGLIDTFTVMYPQLGAIDFRESATRLEVPVWILDGEAELDGRRDVMLEWFEMLEAPAKTRVPYAGAAHSVAFEQADEVRRLLVEEVVPATSGD